VGVVSEEVTEAGSVVGSEVEIAMGPAAEEVSGAGVVSTTEGVVVVVSMTVAVSMIEVVSATAAGSTIGEVDLVEIEVGSVTEVATVVTEDIPTEVSATEEVSEVVAAEGLATKGTAMVVEVSMTSPMVALQMVRTALAHLEMDLHLSKDKEVTPQEEDSVAALSGKVPEATTMSATRNGKGISGFAENIFVSMDVGIAPGDPGFVPLVHFCSRFMCVSKCSLESTVGCKLVVFGLLSFFLLPLCLMLFRVSIAVVEMNGMVRYDYRVF